ncbi:hypothetical protein A9P82_08975 [Arachidicoccus ginsenosidimutans]|uniref:SufE family protein n=1 Tax=Arachidicoccus sp. BS20 TaxID=1850526 RepID=UPI0007F167BF|nr:SufE family protein [Arachidicoccus sp. BS20]ANI89416.1 hypothetical protein A9P82_08975 [Arachidicoccus sp. BS20]
MDINKIQDAIIQRFENLTERVSRFKYFRHLIRLGMRASQSIEPTERNEQIVVHGTKNKIWLKAYCENGKVFFRTDSENAVSKGIAGLLSKVFSGHTPKEIINSNLYFLHEINLYDRLNTVWVKEVQAIMQKMKSLAIGFRAASFSV